MMPQPRYSGPHAERSEIAIVRCTKGLTIQSIEGTNLYYTMTGPFTERDMVGLRPGQYGLRLTYATSSYAATDSASVSITADAGEEYVIDCQINSATRTWKPIIYATRPIKFEVR
jgi:hypothetical protein